ncbi:MAG: hypothetical protein O9272_04305 [Brevundimonas sp.]|nr:hypothetical protein [Brevundimonas sp.]
MKKWTFKRICAAWTEAIITKGRLWRFAESAGVRTADIALTAHLLSQFYQHRQKSRLRDTQSEGTAYANYCRRKALS